MTEAKARTMGGTAQAVLPTSKPPEDTRILCWRFPIGWNDWEVRLEAHRPPAPGEFGCVFMSDNEGNRIELDWYTLRDLAAELQSVVDRLWDDREESRKASAGEVAR